jgi:DNA invertase Pin-like site-specific DNA recombinase
MDQSSYPAIENPTAVIFLRARHRGSQGPDRAQEQHMIIWQRVACEQAAHKLGAQVIREYAEYGGTGSINIRPIVRLMLNELHARHDATYLIVDRAERLARQAHDRAMISLKIHAAGAELIIAAIQTNTGIIKPLNQ